MERAGDGSQIDAAAGGDLAAVEVARAHLDLEGPAHRGEVRHGVAIERGGEQTVGARRRDPVGQIVTRVQNADPVGAAVRIEIGGGGGGAELKLERVGGRLAGAVVGAQQVGVLV